MATSTITALGAGSGVDVKALAQSLVDAEKTPRKDVIDKKIAKSEGGISGYGALKFVLSDLNSAFENLKDASVIGKITPKISQPSSFIANVKPGATTSSHNVIVRSLAQSQKSVSAGFSNATQALCTKDLQINISIGPSGSQTNHPIQISSSDATPEGIVAAINNSKLGVSAQLLKTNESY
jgi:flagellar hook-associated protein 2